MVWRGSIINRMQEGLAIGEPFVGMGATEMCYTDRHAYTVQKVISPNRVIVTRDFVKRVDDRGCCEDQDWVCEETPLVESGPELRCTNLFAVQLGVDACKYHCENGCCDGCEYYKKKKSSNGVELRKCKNGWKKVGEDTYFSLGFKDEYYDFSF